jgi:hypothetical protein
MDRFGGWVSFAVVVCCVGLRHDFGISSTRAERFLTCVFIVGLGLFGSGFEEGGGGGEGVTGLTETGFFHKALLANSAAREVNGFFLGFTGTTCGDTEDECCCFGSVAFLVADAGMADFLLLFMILALEKSVVFAEDSN